MARTLLILLLIATTLQTFARNRFWRLDGKRVEAELVGVEGDNALLQDKSGGTQEVPIASLSRHDQNIIKRWRKKHPAQTDTRKATDATLRALEIKAAEIINDIRQEKGLSRLAFDGEAADVARAHSRDMVERNYFNHRGKDGRTPFKRLRDGGVNYRAAAENIAINSSAGGAAEAWMNSKGHRTNILNAAYNRTGMGIWRKGSQLYLTQVFMD
ncbi:MAG: CAP domain-containing protein [Lentisphaeria bacterium]|jgi:uncharacterized protein YkwD|nr:CAP domain-containing protein [Lentisphaeria bacterium]MDP7742787.1 CAP domain-containing protein [Lentisphaeria bacterium]